MRICIERIGENAILMHFHAIVQGTRYLENRRTFKLQVIDDFPAVWNYEKLSAKFLFSRVKVIDAVGFLSFFSSFTGTTVKIPLKILIVAK